MFTNMRKSIIKMLSVILFVIIATTGFSADKYWVSGSGSWNDTNHWSETSGGNPGASIPTQFDNVIFDNNSFSQNGQQVIIKDIAVCNDFRWEVENVKAELKSKSYLFKSITKSEIQVYGSLFINENINNEFFGDIVLKGENENEIVIENKINSDIIISAKDGKYYLEEPLNTNGNISLIQGSFITQNHRIECESFIGSGIENRELILGESKIYTKSWNIEVSENIVLNSGESVIYFKEDFSKKTFKTGGLEYNKFSTADAKSAFTYTVTITDVTCNGAENGIIKADVTSGGTQPFTYSLYDSDLILLQSSGAINSTTFTFKPTAAPGVSGGSYLVRIRDAEGTINGGFYFVFEPEVLSAGSISVQTPLSCYDGSDAALEAFPTGGTEPYTYEWFIRSGAVYVPIGQTTKIATGLAQGIYRVFVDDANFCGPEYVQFAFTKPPRNDNEIPPLLVIDDISSTSTCFGLSNGTITITAHGGSAPLTYAIVRTSDSDSSTNAIGTFTGLQADTYKIYVIDDNGCTKQGANETIIEVPNPTASITPDPATTCPSVGLILNGNPLGGSGTYTTHAWSDVGSTSLNFTNIQSPTFTNATSGSYALTYTVTDNNGCIGSDNINVTVKVSSVAPTGATVDNNNFCPGAFANITLSYVGGTLGTGAVARWYSDATFTTLVGTGQNLVIAAPLVTTTYYVRFEGDCNNTTAASVTVTVKTESIAPTSASVDHTNFCVGAYANIILSYTLGTLGTNATAEWYSDAAFTIPIGTGQNLSIPAPLVTTTYYVRFEGDCNNTAAASVTVTVYPNPTATITPDPAITCTFVDLNLDGNPAGGSGTYTTHSWTGADLSPLDDPSIQNPVFNSNTAGTYSFTYTVTDDNGCTGTDNIDVEVNNSATAYAGMDVTLCYDTPYQILDADSADCSGISWSSDGGDGSFDDVNLINPTYTPGVNDLLNGFVDLVLTAHGIAPCSAVTDTVRINYLPILRAAIGKPSPFKIDSVITGTPTHIEVYVKLSSHDYVANLGVYLVSPLDSVVELKPNCELLPTLWQSDATYRFYNDPLDTSATALGVIDECDAFSGTYEFSGDWKKLHGQDPSNGAWRIRVVDYENWGIPGLLEEATIKFSDENKNAVFESILYADSSINKPIKRYSAINGPGITEQTLTITGLTTSCFDLCDATAVVTANGGQPPYLTYEWSDDINFTNIIALTDTVETLCPGVYYARVTDSNGCTAIDSVTVGSPPEIHITNSTVVHNVCYGDSVGEVTLEFSGGTGTLTYTYNTYTGAPKNSGETFNELKAGSYLFTITDVSGCTKDTLITITEGIQISVSYNITPVTCNGGSDGEIQIIASGGLAPYNYSITKIPEWSNTTGVFTGLTGDSVYIAVRDANLCIVFSDTVEITEPSPISIDLIEAFPVSCIGGGFDGEIVVTASGGKGTLRYSLDNITFQPSNTFIGLITGTYSIYVADDCDTVSAIDAAIITGPIPIVIDVVVITDVNTCYGDNTGTITVTASGGTGNYEYSVDNGVNYQPGNLFTGLYAGPYFISVRDDDGCTSADSTVNINQPDELLITSYIVTHSSECNIPANVGEIEIVTVTGGTPGYQYAVTGYPLQASSVFSGLSEGNYTITVQDANGCEVTIDTSVVLKPAMSVVLEKVDISCNGLTDGSISVDISNGTPAYTYLWSNGETTPSISNLPAGTYSVTVTDSNFPNSCVANESVEIIQPDAMQIAINLKDKFCINSDPKNPVLANGAINVDPTGGTPAYTYSWTGPGGYSSTSDYITNLEPGTYSLTITDSRGCIQTVDTIIAEDESFDIVITVSSDTNTICSYADGVNFEVNFTAADTLIWQYTPTQGVVPPNDTIEVSVSPYSFTDYPLISTEYLVKALNEYCEDYYPGSSADPKVFITVNQGLGLYITDNNDVEIDTVKIKFEGTEELYGRVLNTTVSATYNWNPTIGVENPISQITKITPSESMWYYLIGESSDGCVEADSVYFNFIPDVTPSDGFSPNGDGINDFWYIQEIDNFPNNVVQVFNRWGTKVFYQKGYSNLDENKRWDGTIENGKELPTGTYYYIINLNESQGTPQTGPVTIVR